MDEDGEMKTELADFKLASTSFGQLVSQVIIISKFLYLRKVLFNRRFCIKSNNAAKEILIVK